MNCRQEDLRMGDWLGDYWINSGERCQGMEQAEEVAVGILSENN